MPERPRLEVAGGIHHVTSRGTKRSAIFTDDEERAWFLHRLADVAVKRGWRTLTYCLMTNHVHLVVETPEPTLGAGMRDVLSLYARFFNDRHEGRGTVFECRFHSTVVTSDEYLAQLLRYVALNPVRAGLAHSPEAWRWSGHTALVGRRSDPCADAARVAELLAPWGGAAAARYRQLFDTEGRLEQAYGNEAPWRSRALLGHLVRGEDEAAAIATARAHGFRLAEIAAALGVHKSTVVRRAQHRSTRRGLR